MTQERDEQRATFDRASLLYDRARPEYPDALIADVIALSAIPPKGRILEIGCGTGKATLPFARRGYAMLCIELGPKLADLARRHLAPYPGVTIQTGAFEDWPTQEGDFDLAIAATAFHWLDPALAYPKIAQALRPTGALALFWNLHVQDESNQRVFQAFQPIYRQEAPELRGAGPQPWSDAILSATVGEIDRTRVFGTVVVRTYRWTVTYDTRGYLDLLRTYSDHIALAAERRERLLSRLADLIDSRFGGRVTKTYMSTLYVAPRDR